MGLFERLIIKEKPAEKEPEELLADLSRAEAKTHESDFRRKWDRHMAPLLEIKKKLVKEIKSLQAEDNSPAVRKAIRRYEENEDFIDEELLNLGEFPHQYGSELSAATPDDFDIETVKQAHGYEENGSDSLH